MRAQLGETERSSMIRLKRTIRHSTGMGFLLLGWLAGSSPLAQAIVHLPKEKAAKKSTSQKKAGKIDEDDPEILKSHYPVVVYKGPKEPIDVTFTKLRPSSWTSISDIPKPVVGAVVVSEDWAFYQHKGFDVNQIKEAIKTDIEKGRFARGASTITQQVAKNVFLSREKTLLRKAKELYLSVQLEKKLTKSKILEVYFNVVEWGEGVFGIRAASELYFDKEPSLLTAKEGAFLAMLLPSPKKYSQSFRDKQLSPYARKTVRSILQKMIQAGYIAEEDFDAVIDSPLPFEKQSD